VLKGTGVHLKWFAEEYSTNEIKNYNNKFHRDEEIQYFNIGSRAYDFGDGMVHLKYTHNKLFYGDRFCDTQNDGVSCLDESDEGVKLADLMHNHFDLIGLNGRIDNRVFEMYADHFKSLEIHNTNYI
jgi:hypothetical protein